MNAIDEIKHRLQKYPQVESKIEGNRVSVLPLTESGFVVSLTDNAPDYTVSFDVWHEEYEDAEKALDAFAFGLSEDCRLKVTLRGNFACVWTVEEKREGGEWLSCNWIGLSEVGLLAPPLFWIKKRYIYLQNDLIKSDKNSQ